MNKLTKLSILLLIIASVSACQKVPITGRKQMKLLPRSTMSQMGAESYSSFLKENPPVNPPTIQSATVTSVGQKVSAAVEKYMNDNGYSSRIEGYKWEFNVVESNEINAWCMPGGKVVVYTGILPLTKDDAGLAVVIGHEIAHAIADHGNERMSQQLAIQLGGISLAVAMQQKPQQTQDIFLTAYGIGSQLGQLAYSRQHELEADKLGLIFMAMAGYDPHRAITFWQEMASKGGSKPPQILSTHPSDQKRIDQITAFLPEAMKYYKQGGIENPVNKPAQQKENKQGTQNSNGQSNPEQNKKKTGVKVK
ncbi:MAG: M48 family metallopeptidase [Bacteroidales bacterium]|nr:M48 family metallopeptidase [Bacteroidales bacterium]